MRSLTIAIPALNEERKLSLTVTEMLFLARSLLTRFEIIIVNDGSTDNTGRDADELAKNNPEVSVIHHPVPTGLGQTFKECVAKAKYDYFMLMPGDHAYNTDSFRPILESLDSFPLIVGCRTNQDSARSSTRVFLSRMYSKIMGTLFGCRLSDFHGPIVFPLDQLQELELEVIGYTFQLEALVKLLRRKLSYVEKPVILNREEAGSSRSLRWKTFFDLVRIVCHLLATSR